MSNEFIQVQQIAGQNLKSQKIFGPHNFRILNGKVTEAMAQPMVGRIRNISKNNTILCGARSVKTRLDYTYVS